ncbi:hypothetical protein N825_27160 [Skermanella stibiiresistens SB22]|uniref:Uncharacterized protein n=1 Tax=Skermanella stibiiresistens SB22 TaxID=1385369 RepID=W9GVF4_9PROT|nr:hypothetical protein N825_27160 [Skermanella stibiiresistens SB22]
MNLKSFLNGFGVVFDNLEVSSRSQFRSAPPLFPILDGADIQTETSSELRPAQTSTLADRGDVHGIWNMDLMGYSSSRVAAHICHGFAHRLDQLVTKLAHLSLLVCWALSVAANVVTTLFWSGVRFDCSPFPYTNKANRGILSS